MSKWVFIEDVKSIDLRKFDVAIGYAMGPIVLLDDARKAGNGVMAPYLDKRGYVAGLTHLGTQNRWKVYRIAGDSR